MKKLFLFHSLLLIMNLNNSFAEVWHAHQKWNETEEQKYSKWIENKISKKIFTERIGILSKVPTDCADALYDLRILYSYLHSLPFTVNAPDVLKKEGLTFGNNTKMFDYIKDERQRVRAFINFINNELGTQNLIKDTYPIKIEDIDAGTNYLVEWKLFGKTNRHSYFIKGFDEDNEPIYFSSDAPKKVRKLQQDDKYPRFSFTSSPFGFRKWRHPEIILTPESEIPENYGMSYEQYELAKRVGKKNVLKEINQRLKPINH